MTYDARERSTHDGSPVELYEFRRAARTWRYTSQATDYDLDGVVYTAVAMTRSSTESTQDVDRSDLRVTLPRDVEVAESFVAIPPANVMLVTVRRVHRGDAADTAVVVWMGRVLNAEWREVDVELTCEPVFTSLRRPGLRAWYGRNCRHAVYDSGCRADPTLHRVNGTVAAINGSTVTIPEASGIASGQLAGGYAAWTAAGGEGEQRTILSNVGDQVELIAPPFGLEVGFSIQVHDGCPLTLAVCNSRFNNTPNYGGFPFIPAKNPFDGQPSF